MRNLVDGEAPLFYSDHHLLFCSLKSSLEKPTRMDHAQSPLKGFTSSDLTSLVQAHFGIAGSLSLLPGELDINAILTSDTGEKYLLKIAHQDADQANIEMQNALMQHLQGKALELELPKVKQTLNGSSWVIVKDGQGMERIMRLLSFVEGQLWAEINPQDAGLLCSLGKAVGSLCQGLQDFDHPAAHRHFKLESFGRTVDQRATGFDHG